MHGQDAIRAGDKSKDTTFKYFIRGEKKISPNRIKDVGRVTSSKPRFVLLFHGAIVKLIAVRRNAFIIASQQRLSHYSPRPRTVLFQYFITFLVATHESTPPPSRVSGNLFSFIDKGRISLLRYYPIPLVILIICDEDAIKNLVLFYAADKLRFLNWKSSRHVLFLR